MNKFIKLLLLSFILTFLSACGGGSDSNVDNVSIVDEDTNEDDNKDDNEDDKKDEEYPPMTVDIQIPQTANEGISLPIDINIQDGHGDESFSVVVNTNNSDFNKPTQTRTETGISLLFEDVLFKSQDYKIIVTVSKGDESIAEEFDLTVNSVKGNNIYSFAKAVNETLPAQRQFISEWFMVERLVKGINLSGGDIDLKLIKPIYIESIHAEEANDNNLMSAMVNDYVFDDYEANKKTWEESFYSFISSVSSEDCSPPHCLNDHISRSQLLFDYVFDRSNNAIEKPAYGNIAFDSKTNTYSIFYKAPENGNFDERGQWTFKPEFSYLEDIIVAGHQVAYEFSNTQ